METLTKSQSCFLLNGGRPKYTHTDPWFFLGLASLSKASQCHICEYSSLAWLLLFFSRCFADIVDYPESASKCLSTLLSERPKTAPKSGSGVVTEGGVPSAGHFDKTASCFSTHTRKRSLFESCRSLQAWEQMIFTVLISYYWE